MATIPNDPLFPNQWHLQNTVVGNFDLNIVDVWDDYTGAGVEVAVIDDGVQRTHPDLDGNYSTAKDWDFILNQTDPSSLDEDNHGTAVAGIIGANANNGIGGVGVAYSSTLFGFRAINFEDITEAINNASGRIRTGEGSRNREADIVNISRGIKFETTDDNGNLIELNYFKKYFIQLNQAIDNALEEGRNGLGTILVKSAGNDRTRSFFNADTNASSWNANPHTISVAAVDQDGYVSSYSTHGASVLVSAFGSPGQVVTTDRIGSEGYNRTGDNSDYTFSFNGTSASAPMVSGVVALMLEANPNLGWRDVQEILAYSARHVGSDVGSGINNSEEYAWSFNGANNWNGGGLHFSNDYGFGLVDAKAAVRLAETWSRTAQTSENDVSDTRGFLDFDHTVSREGSVFNQSISSNIDIEHVEVDISFSRWDDLGDLEVRLISPDGTSSILIENSGENDGTSEGGFGAGQWKFYSNAFRGESTVGTWRIELTDSDSMTVSPIEINDINITFKGQSDSIHETFIFTEEYSKYAGGGFGHSTAINGGNGNDTINAAAVDSETTIDLARGTGSVDGVNITLSSIEHVVTGDGDDQLLGNRFDNRLVGMRGNDYLDGNYGNDVLLGGTGNDTLYGGDGDDRLYGEAGDDYLDAGIGHNSMIGGSGDDTYIYRGSGSVIENDSEGYDTVYSYKTFTMNSASIERLYLSGSDAIDAFGGSNDNLIYGNSANNTLQGNNGNDTIHGQRGRDNLYGGNGDDYLSGDDGNDFLSGNAGTDTLIGGNGNDYLVGSSTNARDTHEYDNLYGGLGYDTFALGDIYSGQLYGGTGYAIIKDWSSFYDTVQLTGDSSQYALRYGNWTGGSTQDTAIVSSSNEDDFYGVIQDSTNISFTNDLTFV